MRYREIEGDLIKLAQSGQFNFIGHGCNCWNKQGKGLAPQMVKAFHTDKFMFEQEMYRGDRRKLGKVDVNPRFIELPDGSSHTVHVGNLYTQYNIASYKDPNPFDYEAFRSCLKWIAEYFRGERIGLPQIGAGLAKGDWSRIKSIIQEELDNCDVTVVIYKP